MYREPSSVRSQEPRLRRGKTIENRVGLMGNGQWAVSSWQWAVSSGQLTLMSRMSTNRVLCQFECFLAVFVKKEAKNVSRTYFSKEPRTKSQDSREERP